MKRYSYSNLLQQKIILATLILGLVLVSVGVFVEIISTSRRTTIPANTRKLIQPLNPQLNLAVVEVLEGYERVTIEQAREGTREFLENLPRRESELSGGRSGQAVLPGGSATDSATTQEDDTDNDQVPGSESLFGGSPGAGGDGTSTGSSGDITNPASSGAGDPTTVAPGGENPPNTTTSTTDTPTTETQSDTGAIAPTNDNTGPESPFGPPPQN